MKDRDFSDADYRPGKEEFLDEDPRSCDETSSADELEACTASTRRSMDRTLNSLEDRVAPSQVWRRMKKSVRSPSDGTVDLDREIRKNPIPFALIGGGLMLVGAGVAAFAYFKLRESTLYLRDSDLPPESEVAYTHTAGGEPIVTSESWAEPDVTPEAEPIHGIMGEEATTEEIQKEVLKRQAQETKAQEKKKDLAKEMIDPVRGPVKL